MSERAVDVDALRAALEAATDGPWEATSGAPARPFEWGIRTAREPNYAVTLHWSSREDAELICLLRNQAEALLDALAASEAKVARVEAVARTAPIVSTAGQAVLMAGQRLLTSRQVLAALADQPEVSP